MPDDRRTAIAGAFHPVAFAVAYVLNVWVATALSIFAIGRALIIAVICAVLLVAIAWLALRDARRAGFVATAVVAFVIFGRDAATVVGNVAAALPPWQAAILSGLLIALVVALVVVGRRIKLRLGADVFTRALNALAVAILLVVATNAVLEGMVGQTAQDLHQGGDIADLPARAANPDRPDIYVIFLDGYPRADVLASAYGFDNSLFLNALRDRGLDVAPASHSNYVKTQFALLTMFNVRLLQDIPALRPILSGKQSVQPLSRRLLNSNPVLDQLHEMGYVTIGFSGSYEDVALRQADAFLDTGHMNELEWNLISRTFIVDAVDAVLPDFFVDQQRAFIDASFDQAIRVAQDRDIGPRFLLAHVFAPHAPLVYGAPGENVTIRALRRTDDTAEAAGLTIQEFGQRLRAEIEYLNRRTLDLIDTIKAQSPTPPIIIVMSDHGPRSRRLDPEHPEPELVREQYGTLFAALTPGHPNIYPPDTTPAEIMGRLMHAYFGTPYEDPGTGIFDTKGGAFSFVRVGDAPPTPQPSP